MSDRDPRFVRACDAQLARTMRPMTLLVGALLVPSGLFAFALLPGGAAWIVGPYDVVTGAAFLLLHARLRREEIHPGLAHGIAFAMGVALLASAVIGVGLSGQIAITGVILLLVVGAGAFLLSWSWFVAVAGVGVAGWLLAALPLRGDSAFVVDGVLLVLAVLLASLSHASRIAGFRGVLESRWAAEEAEARLRGVLAAAPVAFLALDGDGRIGFVAGSGARERGWSASELVGADARGALADDGPYAAVALAGTPVIAGNERAGRTFETRWVPLRDPSGEPRGALAVSVDVTERRRADEERRLAEERENAIRRLQEMDRFKTRILNTASHELNTPLTPIKLQLHMLKRDAEAMDAKSRAAVRMLDRNFERLSVLVNDIMDVARLQENRLRIQLGPVDLAPIAREALLSFEAAAADRGLKLRLDAERPVPANADPKRILQVLFNLLGNALKFTPEGGTITLRASQDEDGCAVLEVRDTGIGLDAAQLALLFQPFSQVHDASRSSAGGTGLGLYISRGIAEAHGGTLTATSAGPGRGAAFTLRVPGV